MGFRLAEEWDRKSESHSRFTNPLSVRAEKASRRGLSAALSIAIPGAIMWMSAWLAPNSLVPEVHSVSSLQLFNLADRNDANEAEPPTEQTVRRDAQPRESAPLPAPQAPPAEWSLSRIKVAMPKSAPSVPSIERGVDSGSASGVYDPYAGAAPMPLNSGGGSYSAGLLNVAGQNETPAVERPVVQSQLQQIFAELAARQPRLPNFLELHVSVDGAGKIVSVDIVEPEVAGSLAQSLRRAFVSRFVPSGPGPAQFSVTVSSR